MRAEAFVEKFLVHYASQYYDPAKAREYYLRTRELKGRQKGMSEEQKSAWDYTKGQVKEAEKRDVDAASEQRQAVVEHARAIARERGEEIRSRLRTLLEKLSDKRENAAEKLEADLKAESIRIREEAAQKIAALPPIPRGVSDEQRARLEARRAEETAKIRGAAFDDLVKLSDEGAAKREGLSQKIQGEKDSLRDKATADREAVRTELKATVDKARADYDARKQELKAQYEATAQRELEGIRGSLPSAPSSSSKSGKSSGSGKKSGKKDKNPQTKRSGKTMSLQEAAEENVRRLGLTVPKI